VPTSIFPNAAPWLALLALLALKRNRSPAAWWIWLAVIGGLVLEGLLRGSGSFLPSQPLDMLAEALKAVNFGLAAVWLWSGYLGWKHRFLAFVALFGILTAFGGAYCLVTHAGENGTEDTIGSLTVVALSALILSLALSLAGLICRNRYRPVRLLLWCLVMALASSGLVLAPFFVFALLSAGQLVIWEFLLASMILAGMNCGVLLVYLVFSFVNGFYRGRLQALLKIRGTGPPPAFVPAPPVEEPVAK
jgi:hypothetical protein